MSPEVGVPLVALCLVAQGFFSGSEMAMASSNRALLEHRADSGHEGARTALAMLQEDEDRLLATCLFGSTLSLVAGTTVAGLMLAARDVGHPWLLATLYVPLALLFAEALPKTIYRHWADGLAPVLAPALRVVQRLLTPVLWVISAWSRALQGVLGSERAPLKREDIVQLLDDKNGNQIDAEDRAMIRRLLAMNELSVGSAMTPLVDVIGIPETLTVGEAVEVVLREGHSRMPVHRDRVDNIVGRVHHRDLLFAPDDAASVATITRPVKFVPESKRADELLREMREQNDPFAVVVDEYGGSVGIVTMEDLLEQVVGEIEDEGDLQLPGVRRLGEREWRVPARTEIDDLEQAIGRQVPPGDYETVAGLVLAVTGRIPKTGETVRVGRLLFHVEAASERAVHMVRVVIPAD